MKILLALLVLASIPAAAAELPQVTIQARRDALEPRVHRFVYDSISLYEDEMLVRWNNAVCPAVIGLPRDKAEFILARLSQIARTAGIPLADEHCSSVNLRVIATDRPEMFLRQWAKTGHWRMFDRDNLRALERFIATPRPVRAWYNSTYAPSSRTPGQLNASQMPGVFTSSQNFTAPVGISPVGGSRITRLQMRSFTSVIVVVDETRLEGIQLGALADYVAMFAFAQLNPDGELGDTPTILGLFRRPAASGPSGPAGLTPWDEALLEALYHTDPQLVLQRLMMITRIVDHLVPGEAAP